MTRRRSANPSAATCAKVKATFAVLTLLEAGVEEARTIIRRHASADGDTERMIALVTLHGADREARREIEQEAVAAVSALEVFPEGHAKTALVRSGRGRAGAGALMSYPTAKPIRAEGPTEKGLTGHVHIRIPLHFYH